MEIFISEFVCGGGWPDGDVPTSLAVEGGAMLRALCEDCARLPDAGVVTTLDVRCPVTLPSAVEVLDVAHPDEEWERFLELAAGADVTIVIAPELNDTLTTRVRTAREAGANVLAPPTDVIALCSDKLRLAGFLMEHGIPTIPTVGLTDAAPVFPWEGRLVVKPRYGAGSQGIRVVSAFELERLRKSLGTLPTEQIIVQPYIDGEACSIGCIASADGELALLPIARQLLSTDGELRYLGGAIPGSGTAVGAIQGIARQCHESLAGLTGYIGLDFVIPAVTPERPLLVEINPRLCTSYLGYRRLTDENLTARILPGGPSGDVVWKDGAVRFASDGSLTLSATCGAMPCV